MEGARFIHTVRRLVCIENLQKGTRNLFPTSKGTLTQFFAWILCMQDPVLHFS